MPGRLITTASADVALKGLAYLLEAMAKLRTERDVTLTIIGKPKTGKSMDLIDKLGLRPHIDFVSGVPDERIVELYAEAELAVVPSLYEGFSLPAIEAMCTGIPLVATDGGALPEVTGIDGDTVLQCPAGDSGALAAAIARGLDDPALRARIGAAGRQPGRRAVELAALRRDDRRPVPRGVGDAAQRREAAAERARLSAHDPLRQTRPAARRPRARRRRRFRPPRVRGRSARRITSSPSTTPPTRSRRHGRPSGRWWRRARSRSTTSPVRCAATRRGCRSPTARSTSSSRPRCSSTSRTTSRRSPRWRACSKPGGTFAATVPSWFPEKINWMLCDEYHAPKSVGGHVRIYSLHRAQGEAAGSWPRRHGQPPRARAALAVLVVAVRRRAATRRPQWVARYKQFLEWDIIKRPRRTRMAERVLSPVLGKSVVLYAA